MNYCLNFCHNCDYIFENYYRAKIFDKQYNYGNELLLACEIIVGVGTKLKHKTKQSVQCNLRL